MCFDPNSETGRFGRTKGISTYVVLQNLFAMVGPVQMFRCIGYSSYAPTLCPQVQFVYSYSLPSGIVEYMQKQAGPASQQLATVAQCKTFSHSNSDIRVIAFTSSQKVLERYMESGNGLRMDMELGHATDEAVAMEMGFKIDTIVVFHPR